MKKFCISTLAYNGPNRLTYLKNTIDSFYQNTTIQSTIDWFIFCNGYDENWINTLDNLKQTYKDKLNLTIHYNEINLGVGAGINQLNQMCSGYEYTLFIEDDWYNLPTDISLIPPNWLDLLLQKMDEDQTIDQVFLRRYQHDYEHRQFGYGYWIQPHNVKHVEEYEGLKLVYLQEKTYSNNPHLRRNKRFFELGVYPLPEYFDENGNPLEKKGNAEWGRAEIQAESKGKRLNTAYLLPGVFVHGDGFNFGTDWGKLKQNIKGCGSCKYGFFYPEKYFCGACIKNKDFSYLAYHDNLFIRVIDALHKGENELAKEIMLSHGEEPTINFENL